MLTIVVPETEYFDETTNEFIVVPETLLNLEHSLVSLSKWESKWEKPFLTSTEKTDEEAVSYIKFMTIDENVPQEVYRRLTRSNLKDVQEYIEAKMTATTFVELPGKGKVSSEIVTAELIYFWMITFKIPFECQHWHLNRLTTLIKVCERKNQPSKKMSKSDIAARYRELNAKRKAQYGTTG